MSANTSPPENAAQGPAPGVAAPRGKGGVRKAVRWALWTVIVLAILVAATPFLLSTGWAKALIETWLDENVDRKVEFAALDVSWSDGIRLDGLVVHDEFERNPPLLTAPHVVIRTPLISLLTRKVKVEEFLIEDAVLTLSRRDDGALNTTGVMKRRKPLRAKQAAPDAPKPTDGAVEETVLPEIHVPVEIRNLAVNRKGA